MTTTVTVYPGADDPTHNISLTDPDGITYGFKFLNGPRGFQEIPLSPPAQQFDIKQKAFTGGRGIINVADDNTGFYDSQNLWSTSEGMIFPSPQWRYATGVRSDVDELMPYDNCKYTWVSTVGANKYFAMSFVASNSVAMDKVAFFTRIVGTPGALVVELCSDNAGDPGTVLKTVTVSTIPSDIASLQCVFKTFDWTGTEARTASTKYWIKITGAGADTSNCWQILTTNEGTIMGKTSAAGSVWVAGVNLYFRVTGADTNREWFEFDLYGAKYAVSKNADRTASTLLMNGFRGIASATSPTSLTCAQTCTRDYAGAFIKIIDGSGDGQIRQITSNTTGASVTFTVPTWDVTPDTTSIFIVYGTKFWDVCTGTSGLGCVVNQPAIVNNIVFFPQGAAAVIRRMRVNGNSHDFAADTGNADIVYANVESTGIKLLAARADLSILFSTTPPAWGGTSTYSQQTIGTTNFRITNMYNYGGQLYVFKEDGAYKVTTTSVVRFGKNFSDNPDANNGAAVTDDSTYLWWTWGHSVERMLGTNVTDMLGWRAGYMGMPKNRKGLITSMLAAIGWLFMTVDGGTSNYSSIICWNGFGWHDLFIAPEVGLRIRSVAWIPCQEGRPQLYFEMNGELVYMEFPQNTSIPVRDTSQNFTPEGIMITPTIDAGSIETFKIIKSIRIMQSNTVISDSPTSLSPSDIYVDYQINANVDTNNWVYLGTVTTIPVSELIANLGEVYAIRFRIRLQTSNQSRNPAVIYGWAVSGREMPKTKYQFIGSFMAGTAMETLTNDDDVSSDITYLWLKTAATEQTKLTLRTLNLSSDSKVVTVGLPIKNVDSIDQEETDQWSGSVQFALYET